MTTYKTGGIADAGPAIIIGLLIGLVAAQLVNPTPQPANAAQTAAFSHEQCQYPDRTTNPPDGCDNSDPANPYCAVKGLPEDCTEPVGTAEKQQAVAEHDKPFNTAQPQAAQCGGK